MSIESERLPRFEEMNSAENSPDYETIGVFKNIADAFALVMARQESLSADEFPGS